MCYKAGVVAVQPSGTHQLRATSRPEISHNSVMPMVASGSLDAVRAELSEPIHVITQSSPMKGAAKYTSSERSIIPRSSG